MIARYLFLTIGILFYSSSWAQVAQFTANTTSICEDLPIQFTDQSTGTITSWIWDFGDGSTSILQNPTHAYAEPGTYAVSLSVNAGADVEIKTGYITVLNAADINVSLSSNYGCVIPYTVNFTNSTAGSGITYAWTFGDGNSSSATSPSNTYTSYGTFNAILSANNGTCIAKDTFPITIQNFQANFVAVPTSVCLGSNINFTDISSHPAATWNWNFGDATTDNAQNPIHNYASANTYNVQLVATSVVGCQDTVLKNSYVTVRPLPIISFTVDDDSACQVPFNVTFTNLNPSLIGFTWNFGDGGTSVNANPSHTYNSLGIFSVSLTAIDGFGCTATDSVEDMILVQSPVALITSNVFNGCEDLVVNFTDASSAVEPIVNWQWDLGNGSTSTNQHPVGISYPDTGSFPMNLIITTVNGCKDTALYLIEVGMPPIVAMGMNNNIGCHPFPVQFTDLSSSYADTWLWNFHDGAFSSLQNPAHTFSADTGYFDITLTASFHGCPVAVTFTDTLYVKQAKPLFSVDTNIDCYAPFIITFTDESRGAEQWTWNFGDGNSDFFIVGSPSANTTHTYASPGSYTIWLVVENFTQGCKDSISTQVHISDLEPGFDVDTTATCLPNAILFADTSVGTYFPHTYFWTMSNGYTNNTETFSYNFNGIAGVYDVTQQVTDGLGCIKTVSKPAYIDIKPLPVVGFTQNNIDGCAPLNVTFADTSSSLVGLQSWSWNYGDGSVLDPSQNGSKVYTNSGQYTVVLTVTDNNNCIASATKNNLVNVTFPDPSFSAPLFTCNNSSVSLINTSLGAGLSYIWSFGDGSLNDSNSVSPLHSYSNIPSTSTFTVTLIAIDSNNCVDSIKHNILLSVPTAAFTQNNTFSICPPLSVQYTDASIGGISAYNWNFGDGATSITENPLHTYTYAGIFDVQLIAIDSLGCRDTALVADLIEVQGITGTASVALDPSACGQTFIFTSTAGSLIDYTWNFGDGQTSSLENPIHIYPTTGNYVPIVTMVDSNNCTLILNLDTITASSTDAFDVTITSSATSISVGNPIVFSASAPETINTWIWNFGNGVSYDTTISAATYTYNTENTYTVSVLGLTADGCSGQGEVTITVYDNTDLISTVFTPNGDGFNDVYTIYNNGAKEHELKVYSRWGQLLFQGASPLVEWYGTDFAGTEVPTGTYYYILKTTNQDNSITESSGYITVIRN